MSLLGTPDEERAYAATEGAEVGFHTQEDEASAPYRRAGAREKKVVYALNSALRVARLHALDNSVAQEALAEFAALLGEFLATKPQVLVVAGENRLYVNGGALRKRRQGHSWLADFLQFMERMGIGGMQFRGTWDARAARSLLESFAAVGPQAPAERLRIIQTDLGRRLSPPAELTLLDPTQAAEMVASDDDEDLPDAEKATFYYARLIALCEAGHAAARAGRSPDFHVRQVRQTLMKVIEFLRTGAFQLRMLGLTTLLPPEQDPFAGHAANVTVLALAMGRLLGLSRGHLADLGFAALYHDLGRALVGREPSAQHPGERQRTALGHVLGGVGASLRGRGYGDAGLLRLVVAQEHHRVVEGYPEATGLRRPHLYSRIVAVADGFDRACQGTPWSAPLSPVRALELLDRPGASGVRHEPAVVQLLKDVLGPRPRGTVLRYPSGEIVVVVDGGARRRGRPVARRLLHADGSLDSRGTLSELKDVEAAAVIEPERLDLDWRRAVLL